MSRAAAPVDLLLRLLGAPPRARHVDLTDDVLEVRLGWLFTLSAPRASVVSAVPDDGPVTGIGAHGWRGTWLVNTSTHGLVRIELDPEVRGRVSGARIGVRTLRLGLADPASFLTARGNRGPRR